MKKTGNLKRDYMRLAGAGDLRMSVEIVIDVHCQIRNASRLGQLVHSPRRIEFVIGNNRRFGLLAGFGFNANSHSLRQLRFWLKHHNAVSDCSAITHKPWITLSTAVGHLANGNSFNEMLWVHLKGVL